MSPYSSILFSCVSYFRDGTLRDEAQIRNSGVHFPPLIYLLCSATFTSKVTGDPSTTVTLDRSLEKLGAWPARLTMLFSADVLLISSWETICLTLSSKLSPHQPPEGFWKRVLPSAKSVPNIQRACRVKCMRELYSSTCRLRKVC